MSRTGPRGPMASRPIYAATIIIMANYFCTCLAREKPHAIQVWYLPDKCRITTRTTAPGTRGKRPPPENGIVVGTYAHPYAYADFKADLKATIESVRG